MRQLHTQLRGKTPLSNEGCPENDTELHLMVRNSYFKPYNYVWIISIRYDHLKPYNYVQIICIR